MRSCKSLDGQDVALKAVASCRVLGMAKASGSYQAMTMQVRTLSSRTWLSVMTDDELETLRTNYLAAIERIDAEMRFRDGVVA